MQQRPYLTHAESLLVNSFYNQIGSNISNIRRKKRISLKRISRLTGYRIDTLDCFELGKKSLRITDIVKLANAMGVRIEDIVAV